MKIDLHSHSTVSDGLDSPTALVKRMADAGLTALALTDHDTLQGLPEARAEANRRGLQLIAGAEISSEWGGQDDIHILALFVDENNATFNAALAERQDERRTRGERMAVKLVEAGYAIDLDAIRADVADGVWGRPHLARALIRAGYAATNDEAFDRFLGREHPWYVPYDKWKAADVLRAIREAGGVSSLAHAVWYKDTEALIRSLAGSGLDAIEVFHPDHDAGQRNGSRRSPGSFRSRRRRAAIFTARPRDGSGRAASSEMARCSTRSSRAVPDPIANRQSPIANSSRTSSVRAAGFNGAVEKCGAAEKKNLSSRARGGSRPMRMRKSWSALTAAHDGGRIAANSVKLQEITAERGLPQNLDAERSVLGAVLLDPAAISLVVPILSEEDFFPDNHRRIYGAMRELSERTAEIDILTLREELDRKGSVEKAGGAAYLTSLLDGVPDVGNVEHYARIVKEKSTLRRLIRAGQRIVRDGLAGERDAESLLAEATGEIFDIAEGAVRIGFEQIGPIVRKNLEIIEDARGRKGMLSGLATGFQELDRMTSGLQATDLIVIAARPSVGKTSFALNVAQHVAFREGRAVGFFSLEMSKEQIGFRVLCSEADVDAKKVRDGYASKEAAVRLVTAQAKIAGAAFTSTTARH